MPDGMRTFVDGSGTEWEVREIREAALSIVPRRHLPHPEYADGWLLFSSSAERRRIAPFPPDWQMLPDSELARWCAQAVPARWRVAALDVLPDASEKPPGLHAEH